MIGNKRIKLVMAGFLIAGATVNNITGVGSFADEIATFGTYNVYHSQSLTAHSAPDTITSKNNASCRNDVIKGPSGMTPSDYNHKVVLTSNDTKTLVSSADTLVRRPDGNGNKTVATNLKKNNLGQPGVTARQRYTVPKINMTISGGFDNN